MMTRRQIALQINAHAKFNQVQRPAPGLSDLWNMELYNDDVEACLGRNLDGKEPEGDIAKTLYHQQQEETTLIKSAMALYPSDKVHHKESRGGTPSWMRLTKSPWEISNKKLIAERGRVKDEATLVVPAKRQGFGGVPGLGALRSTLGQRSGTGPTKGSKNDQTHPDACSGKGWTLVLSQNMSVKNRRDEPFIRKSQRDRTQ